MSPRGVGSNARILASFASCPFRLPASASATGGGSTMIRIRTCVTLTALLCCSSMAAGANLVLDWNAIAVSTVISQGQSPFAQPRLLAITQLAVFEAVNAITGEYKPYL